MSFKRYLKDKDIFVRHFKRLCYFRSKILYLIFSLFIFLSSFYILLCFDHSSYIRLILFFCGAIIPSFRLLFLSFHLVNFLSYNLCSCKTNCQSRLYRLGKGPIFYVRENLSAISGINNRFHGICLSLQPTN